MNLRTGTWWNDARRRALRSALLTLPEPVDCFAEAILGCEERIDFVGRDPERRAVVVILAEEDQGLVAIASAVAQRSWLAPRLGDWHQLNPQLGVRPDLDPWALVVGPGFCARSLLAAGQLGDLALYECVAELASELVLRACSSPKEGARAPASQAATLQIRAPFRTGLR